MSKDYGIPPFEEILVPTHEEELDFEKWFTNILLNMKALETCWDRDVLRSSRRTLLQNFIRLKRGGDAYELWGR